MSIINVYICRFGPSLFRAWRVFRLSELRFNQSQLTRNHRNSNKENYIPEVLRNLPPKTRSKELIIIKILKSIILFFWLWKCQDVKSFILGVNIVIFVNSTMSTIVMHSDILTWISVYFEHIIANIHFAHQEFCWALWQDRRVGFVTMTLYITCFGWHTVHHIIKIIFTEWYHRSLLVKLHEHMVERGVSICKGWIF